MEYKEIGARDAGEMAELFAGAFNAPPWNDSWTTKRRQKDWNTCWTAKPPTGCGLQGRKALRHGRWMF